MKKVLTGLCNNITEHQDKIRIWKNSFQQYSNGDVVLLVANASEQDVKICEMLDIKYHLVTIEDTYQINHKRLEHLRDFFKISEGDVFLITDVFDVVFQNDPFEKLNFNDYDLFLTSEGILLSEEPWNYDVIKKVFGMDIANECLAHEIVCSGVIAGKKEALISLYDRMFNLCESGTNNHNIKDQAALIIMLVKNELKNYKILTLNDGWAMHCATSGPTQFFTLWNMKQNLEKRYNIPEMKENNVYTGNGELFDIVHQFNRVPEWHTIIKNKYLNVL